MRRSLPIAALAAATLAACGSSQPSLKAFRTGFRQDRVQFSRLGADIGTAVTTAVRRSDAALAAEFGRLAARADVQRARLARLKAPARYRRRLDDAVTALGHVAADLRAISAASAGGNSSAARSSAAQLVRDSLAFQSSERILSQALGLPANA